MSRAHKFPWKILPNFHGKFCQIPQASTQNSVAHHGKIIQILWVSVCEPVELYLIQKFLLLNAGIVVSYASSIQRKLSLFFSF